jgi:HlyD family secretion protein
MTTSNKIITSVKENALYIPLECLHSHMDSITFVYLKNGLTTIKQEVIVGETNANDAVITKGLDAADKVYLSIPKGLEDQDFRLLPELNGKRQKEKDQEPKPGDKTSPKVISGIDKSDAK